MDISIRKFEHKDILNKVRWLNDPDINQYLHYNLPLDYDKTLEWYDNSRQNKERYDAVITVDNKPIGLIGLININYNNKQGEYYITIGERDFASRGVAYKASLKLLNYSFEELNLRKVYLFTEQENIGMQKLANRLGMLQESLILNHSRRNNQFYNAYYYSILNEDFLKGIKFPREILSDIEFLDVDTNNNQLFMKRDDLIPFSFGGNKARKAKYFFEEIIEGEYQTIITYGSKFSNHCRVIANMCKKYDLKCIIISPYGSEETNFNRSLIELTNAQIIECEISEVSDTIEKTIKEENLKTNNKVYFIPGGGHGNLGTQAYVDAYHEIEIWSRRNNAKFDYIFLASGTGTTQAGLIIGNIIHNNRTEIIGMSVARKKDYGTQVIKKSIEDYLVSNKIKLKSLTNDIYFYDQYIDSTYGQSNDSINKNVKDVLKKYGVPLNTSYTGKAFTGMKNYILENDIKNKNILFLNTGGVPLFFDDLINFEG